MTDARIYSYTHINSIEWNEEIIVTIVRWRLLSSIHHDHFITFTLNFDCYFFSFTQFICLSTTEAIPTNIKIIQKKGRKENEKSNHSNSHYLQLFTIFFFHNFIFIFRMFSILCCSAFRFHYSFTSIFPHFVSILVDFDRHSGIDCDSLDKNETATKMKIKKKSQIKSNDFYLM